MVSHIGIQPDALCGERMSFYYTALLDTPAHAKHVAVRMTKVHLAYVPGHVGWRKCYLKAGGQAFLVHGINVFHPYRHPDALVSRFITIFLERGCV